MRKRRNPSTGTLILWGGGLLAVGLAIHAATGAIAPPVVVVQSSGPPIKIPNDIAERMLFNFTAAGSPTNQAGWIASVQNLIPGMTATQWATVYQSIEGFQKVNNRWPDGGAVVSWIRESIGT